MRRLLAAAVLVVALIVLSAVAARAQVLRPWKPCATAPHVFVLRHDSGVWTARIVPQPDGSHLVVPTRGHPYVIPDPCPEVP